MGKRKPMTGVYGRLTIIEYDHIDRSRQAFWKCECLCKKIVVVRGNSLRSGKSKSCGCLRSEEVSRILRKPPGESGFNRYYKDLRRGAQKRGLELTISKDQIKIMTQQECHNCGAMPCSKSTVSAKGSTPQGIIHSTFVYNGIDRVDNSKGYTPENSKTSCAKCNRWKSDDSQEEFIKHANMICAYQETMIRSKT